MKIVVDSNVVIHGKNKQEFNEIFTVPEVFAEMKSQGSKRRINNLDIKVKEPKKGSIEKVKSKSEEIKSPTSETDEKLVALAESMNLTIISDDKAVQNLALHLDIDFEGYIEDKIEESFKWKIKCCNCNKTIQNSTKNRCPRCGHPQFRRKQY